MQIKKNKKYIDPVTQERIERETIIESQKKPQGCKVPLIGGCLVPIAVFALMLVCIKECKRADIRLEQEKIKLEQMKDGTRIDTTPAIKPDTLKIGSFQKEYIPLLKQYQRSK